MSLKTIALGLTVKIPNRGHNPWTSDFEAEFANKLSEHDHTGSGKGVQIGASALAADAVETAKIKDGNVTQAKLASTIPGLGLLHSSVPTSFSVSATDPNQTIMPVGGAVTHLSINRDAGAGSATLNATLYKNGVSTGKSIQITTTTTKNSSAITAETFVAGDALGIVFGNPAGASITNARAQVFGYMRL